MPDDLTGSIERLSQARGNSAEMALAALDFLLDVQPEGSELRKAIEAAAVPHWFDFAILAQLLLLQEVEARALTKRLAALPMIEPFAGRSNEAKNVHTTTRLALRNRLYSDDPDYLRLLSQRAYKALGNSLSSDIVTERLYHRFIVEPDLAADESVELLRAWTGGGRPELSETLSGVLEELEHAGLITGRPRAEALLVIGWVRSNRGEVSRLSDLIATAVTLARENGNPSTIGRALAIQGDLLVAKGNLSQAITAYTEADQLLSTVLAEDSTSSARLFDFGSLRLRLGDTALTEGRVDDALALHRESLEIARQLVAMEPDIVAWRRNLAIAHSKLGDVFLTKREFDSALTVYRDNFETVEKVAVQDSANVDWQRDLSTAYSKIGNVFIQKRQFSDAQSPFREASEILKKLAHRDPANVRFQRDFSVSLSKLGESLMLTNELDAAIPHLRQSVEIMENLVKLDSTNVGWQSDLAVSYIRAAWLRVKRGQTGVAVSFFDKSLRIRRGLVQADPSDKASQQQLAIILTNYADYERSRKRYRQARTHCLEGVNILARLIAAHPDHSSWSRDHHEACELLARIDSRK